jgi:hypothetical protein
MFIDKQDGINIEADFISWDGPEHSFNKFGKELKIRTAECEYAHEKIYISVYDNDINKLDISRTKKIKVIAGFCTHYINPNGKYKEPKVQISAGHNGVTEVI